MHVHRQNRHLERRDSVRPYDAAFVVVLLNRRSYYTRYPDTVATHRQDLVTAIFTLYGGFQCFGVLGTQLEDVTNFDTTFDQQRTLTIRAWIARHHVADISNFRGSDIAIPVDAEVVFTIDVSTSSEITHRRNGTVNHHRNRHVYRTQ